MENNIIHCIEKEAGKTVVMTAFKIKNAYKLWSGGCLASVEGGVFGFDISDDTNVDDYDGGYFIAGTSYAGDTLKSPFALSAKDFEDKYAVLVPNTPTITKTYNPIAIFGWEDQLWSKTDGTRGIYRIATILTISNLHGAPIGLARARYVTIATSYNGGDMSFAEIDTATLSGALHKKEIYESCSLDLVQDVETNELYVVSHRNVNDYFKPYVKKEPTPMPSYRYKGRFSAAKVTGLSGGATGGTIIVELNNGDHPSVTCERTDVERQKNVIGMYLVYDNVDRTYRFMPSRHFEETMELIG